jgi:hypothetical protein
MALFALALLASGASASPTAVVPLQPEALTCSACEDDAWTRTVAAGHDGGEPIKEVDVVVSLCTHDLTWLQEYIEGLRSLGAPVRNVTIYSKCGAVAPVAHPLIEWSQTVVELPNVGRCDHTYAYHMAEKFWDLADATIFIKDSYDPNSPQADRVAGGLDAPRKVDYTWEHLKRDGVTCLYDSGASHGASVWHETQPLSQWKLAGYSADQLAQRLRGNAEAHSEGDDASQAPVSDGQTAFSKQQQQQFQSSVRPLGAWLKQTMGIDLAERTLWPVCYGGLFGATKKTIHRTSRTSWEQMRDSLTRGDNIEEGHYAERSWLGLLSQPLTESNERKLQGAATGTCGLGPSAGSCLAGQLRTCDCAQLAKREADTVSLDVPLPPSTGGIATCDTCGSCWCKF